MRRECCSAASLGTMTITSQVGGGHAIVLAQLQCCNGNNCMFLALHYKSLLIHNCSLILLLGHSDPNYIEQSTQAVSSTFIMKVGIPA